MIFNNENIFEISMYDSCNNSDPHAMEIQWVWENFWCIFLYLRSNLAKTDRVKTIYDLFWLLFIFLQALFPFSKIK